MVTEGTILSAGDVFGELIIEQFLSADALTETYLARQGDKKVAVRCMDRARAASPPSAEAFAAGLGRLRTLHDEGIPAVHDGGILDGVAWLTTDYLQGGSLRSLLSHLLPHMYTYLLGQAVEWAVTLQTAHGAGFLHGDLRPENIVFQTNSDEPGARLVGVGCADLFGMTPEIASRTPLYRAPEQLSGGPVDARADIYSFGMILYEMLALRPPFAAQDGSLPNLLKLRTMAMMQMPLSLRTIHPSFPRFVASFIEKAIAKDPRDRFQLMAEVIEAMDDAADRIEVWAEVYEEGGKIPVAERERIRKEMDRNPARAAESGRQLARRVRFGLHGYEAPPLDLNGDTDPAGPPDLTEQANDRAAKGGEARERGAKDRDAKGHDAKGGHPLEDGARGGQAEGAKGAARESRAIETTAHSFGARLDTLLPPPEMADVPDDERERLPETEPTPETLRAAPPTPRRPTELRTHPPGRRHRALVDRPAAALLLLALIAGVAMDFASQRGGHQSRARLLVPALGALSFPPNIAAQQTEQVSREAQPQEPRRDKVASRTSQGRSARSSLEPLRSGAQPAAPAPAPAPPMHGHGHGHGSAPADASMSEPVVSLADPLKWMDRSPWGRPVPDENASTAAAAQ